MVCFCRLEFEDLRTWRLSDGDEQNYSRFIFCSGLTVKVMQFVASVRFSTAMLGQ